MKLEETRDIKRALNDIKLLVAYIEGKEFEKAPCIQINKHWEIADMSQNYPITYGYEYRVFEPKIFYGEGLHERNNDA